MASRGVGKGLVLSALALAAWLAWEPREAFAGKPPAAAAAPRCERVVMHGAQAGRFNYGYSPTQLKKAKYAKVMNFREIYGKKMKRPRRWPLYDIMEHLHEKYPQYTVINEPNVPLQPVWDVPVTERYPWAGPLKMNKVREERENESPMEVYHGSYARTILPPLTRHQRYIHRHGTFSNIPSPQWINRPIGGWPHYHGDKKWAKDRRTWTGQLQYSPEAFKTVAEEERMLQAAQDVDLLDQLEGSD